MKMKEYPEAPDVERIKLIFQVHRMKLYDFEMFYGIPLTNMSLYMAGRLKVPKKHRHIYFDPPKAIADEFEKRFEMNQKAMRYLRLESKKHNRYKCFAKKKKIIEDVVKEQKVEVKRIGVLAQLLSSSSGAV